MMKKKESGPNLMLYGFVFISLCVHFFIFSRIADMYKTKKVSCIELSMRTFSRPDFRRIPKPRIRTRPVMPSKAMTSGPCTRPVPKIRMNMAKEFKMDYAYEKIRLPRLPGHLNMAGFNIPSLEPRKTENIKPDIHENRMKFSNARDYFEMVALRINRFKEYPEYARSRYIQGRVRVEFTIKRDGSLSNIRIVKGSRQKELDQAALEAVSKASPFPRPPLNVFTPPVKFRVTIVFELV